jgi:hypothetical protein
LILDLKIYLNKSLITLAQRMMLFFSYIQMPLKGNLDSCSRDKAPKTLVEAQEQATKIEENLSVSKVEPFHAPHAKAETKPRTLKQC